MKTSFIRGTAIALSALLLLTGCGTSAAPAPGAADDHGPQTPLIEAGPAGVSVTDGDDWTLPEWVRPATNSGFFSEEASPEHLVDVRSIDVTWRQIRPTAESAIDGESTGSAQEMDFAALDSQLAEPEDYWMRLFASGEDWAPEWVAQECGVSSYGPDYDGQRHLPLWNECVWSHLLDTYRLLFVDRGLIDDERLRFVYVPGGFTWAEYDYDMISAAVDSGDLTEEQYLDWYSHAWTDLAEIFGEHADKLVFTGEDYPWGPFGEADDLLAAQAVDAGIGIRNGITELFNFHLSEAPAYGSHVQPNGHLVVDESLPIHSGRYVVATENECYNACDYETDDPYYAVRQSNLKTLQLRMNWLYVVPGDSYLEEYPEHWDWMRLSLGQTAETSADAWAALRDAEDLFWAQEEDPGPFADPASWADRPWVRNLERWLVQVDEPGSNAHRTDADVHTGVLEAENGTAHEGLSTQTAAGDTGFVFEVDPRFAASATGSTLVKVTFLDEGTGDFVVETAAGSSAPVTRTGSGRWQTATIALPAGALNVEDGVAPRIRIALADGADDLVARFVRVVQADRNEQGDRGATPSPAASVSPASSPGPLSVTG